VRNVCGRDADCREAEAGVSRTWWTSNWSCAERELCHAIRNVKLRVWRELLWTLEADPSGRPYQMVLKKTTTPIAPVCETLPADVMANIVGSLFPVRVEGPPPRLVQPMEWDNSWDVTEVEVTEVVKRLSGSRKAPGPDGIPGLVIRKMAGLLLREGPRFHCMFAGSGVPEFVEGGKISTVTKERQA